MTNKQIMANELLKAVDKYRIDQHCTFEHGAKEAIRILERHLEVKPVHKLLTESEFLNSKKRRRKKGFGWRWWPCTPWRVGGKVGA